MCVCAAALLLTSFHGGRKHHVGAAEDEAGLEGEEGGEKPKTPGSGPNKTDIKNFIAAMGFNTMQRKALLRLALAWVERLPSSTSKRNLIAKLSVCASMCVAVVVFLAYMRGCMVSDSHVCHTQVGQALQARVARVLDHRCYPVPRICVRWPCPRRRLCVHIIRQPDGSNKFPPVGFLSHLSFVSSSCPVVQVSPMKLPTAVRRVPTSEISSRLSCALVDAGVTETFDFSSTRNGYRLENGEYAEDDCGSE